MTNKQDFGGAENGSSDELTRGNNGIDSLASGDAGASPLSASDWRAFTPECSALKNTSKKQSSPWYLSRTLYINLAALLSLIFPAVREWLENNPIDFFAALGGVNVLLRFVTFGKYQLSPDDAPTGNGTGEENNLESAAPVPGENDLANSSIAGAGTSNPSKPGTIKRNVLLTIGVLIALFNGSCSSEAPAPTSVSLSEGQAVIVRGGSSLVIDQENHSLSWAQDMPDVVIAPAVVQGK